MGDIILTNISINLNEFDSYRIIKHINWFYSLDKDLCSQIVLKRSKIVFKAFGWLLGRLALTERQRASHKLSVRRERTVKDS